MHTIASLRASSPVAFDALVDKIQRAGTDNLSHFKNGYKLEGGYSLQQNPFEFAGLVTLLAQKKAHLQRVTGEEACRYLEIGTASGGVLRFLVEEEPLDFELVAFVDDGRHHRAPERDANVNQAIAFSNAKHGCGVAVAQYIGDSHADLARDYLRALVERPGVPRRRHVFHVAFIDGDHSYAGVKADTELVLPFMAKGGLVIYHDIVACAGDVGRCWKETTIQKKLRSVAELIGDEVPLGIAVGEVL